jgi:hypothetical protein
MIRRLRMILPQDSILVMYASFYFVAIIGDLIWYVLLKMPMPGEGAATLYKIAPFGILPHYAWYRTHQFHPAFQPGYRQWLEMTPWTWRKPLPGGPVHLVWEDSLILLFAIAPASYRGAITPWQGLSIFLASYAAWLTSSFWKTGAKHQGYATLIGLAIVLRLWPKPQMQVCAAAAVALVALLGLRRSLQTFPWNAEGFPAIATDEVLSRMVRSGRMLGWPYDNLGPKAGDFHAKIPSKLEAILIALLLGLWAHALASCIVDPMPQSEILRMLCIPAISMFAMFRLVRYMAGYQPPISLWGRLATFRLLIPSYDKVFLTPIAILLAGAAAVYELQSVTRDPMVVYPITLSVVAMVALLGGPSARSWVLTGGHRVVSSGVNATMYVKVG